jgi:ribosomal protein S18 acetylase RimI-like enzyme
MSLAYREDYWDSPDLKKKFISFMIDIFALDLSLWDSKGFWDVSFKPYSYFDDSSLVANVCVYSMDMMVDGKRCRVAQVSSVGTRPEYRRKGIGLELMQKGLERTKEEHEYCFLFADEEAYGFYQRCGFQLTDEYKARITVSGHKARSGVIKVNMQESDHIKKVYDLVSKRQPVSDILGVYNERLFMFWCLYALRDHIYYIPDLDILVLCKRNCRVLTLFDIVGARMPSFAEIYPYIRDPDDEAADFLFMIDKLSLDKFDHIRIEGNGTHIFDKFPLDGDSFIFPYTSHA